MFHLLPYLNVVDNVRVAARGATALARSTELLERFGLGSRLRHRPDQLSVGERQRVAVARAIVNDPRLILADEPTGNLDPANAAVVLEMLAAFHRGGGTVLLVTHDEAAARQAQRILRLAGGKVVDAKP
jgi:putative ABC transport system ATP-binding protein